MVETERWTDQAAQQHGVVSRKQLYESGMTRGAVRHAVASGRLEPLSERVFVVCGSPDTPLRRAMAAVLDTSGGAVGLWSALALSDVPGYPLEPVHVVTPRRPHRGSPHLAVVHSSVRFSEADVVRIHGIPATSPVSTLIGLAPRLHPGKAADLCDDLLRRRVLALGDLHRAVAELPRHGGNGGYAVLRAIAELRPEGYRPTDSRLEREFERILERAGEAPFDRQVDVGDGDGWIGRVDFLDRALRLVVEVQSTTFHSSLSDRRRDAERIARLRAAGWIVVEITEDEIRRRPSTVLERVRAARALAATRVA